MAMQTEADNHSSNATRKAAKLWWLISISAIFSLAIVGCSSNDSDSDSVAQSDPVVTDPAGLETVTQTLVDPPFLLSLCVLQSVSWQHHDGAVHARNDVERSHHSARSAVVDKDAGFDSLEPEDDLFTRIHERELAASQCAGRCVEIDVVLQGVGRRIYKCQFNEVVLVDHDHRSWHAAIEGQCPDLRAVRSDLN